MSLKISFCIIVASITDVKTVRTSDAIYERFLVFFFESVAGNFDDLQPLQQETQQNLQSHCKTLIWYSGSMTLARQLIFVLCFYCVLTAISRKFQTANVFTDRVMALSSRQPEFVDFLKFQRPFIHSSHKHFFVKLKSDKQCVMGFMLTPI